MKYSYLVKQELTRKADPIVRKFSGKLFLRWIFVERKELSPGWTFTDQSAAIL